MAKPSVTLTKDAETVEAFIEAYDAYLAVLQAVTVDPYGAGLGSISGLVEWRPLSGCEEEAARRRAVVATRAGAAADIASRAAGFLHIRPAFGRPSINVNPVQAWANPLEPASDMKIQSVRDFANQAAGNLRAQAAEARQQESGPVWWIARFVRLPLEVREAAGLKSKGGQAAAAGVGVFVQGVAIAVVAGLIVLLIQAIV